MRLRNVVCPFCGVALTRENSTREHAVSRRSVPIGSLNRSWNVLLNACRTCNRLKGDLEDDIPAITMQPDTLGRFAANDQRLIGAAIRRGQGSISRFTGKRVVDSYEDMTETYTLGGPGGPTVMVTSTGPPQPSEERLEQLAWFQVVAFFYHLTYDDATQTGGRWVGEMGFLPSALRSDWGNSQLISFMRLVRGWVPWLVVPVAEGYFQVAIRKDPSNWCWSWALELNKNLRMAGFFGPIELVQPRLAECPEPQMMVYHEDAKVRRLRRFEVPLAEADDTMFEVPEGAAEAEEAATAPDASPPPSPPASP